MKIKKSVWRGKGLLRAIGAGATVAALAGVANSSYATTANVNIEDDFFSPSTSTISAGDSVTWTWVGTDGHTVTSESKPTAAWNSTGTNFPPFTFTVNFPNSGTFPYECKVHVLEGMVGSIKVGAAAANPPTVSITSPVGSATFTAPATVSISADASDAGGTISDVEFLIDSTSIADVTSAPYQTSADNVAAGAHTITAIATAANGLKATNAVNIQVNAVQNSPPAVSITSPTNAEIFTAPATVDIAATATDPSSTIADVQFLIDSTPLADVTSAPYQTAATGVTAGPHTITAIATSNDGLKATNTVSIQINAVQNPPPSITIDATNLVVAPGSFQFDFSADTNSSYVVERSTDLINWVSIATNEATANPDTFTDTNAPAGGAYYKVELVAP